MYHKANIRLVNAHPKGNGRNNHVDLFIQEIILIFHAYPGFQPGVIRGSINAVNF